MRFFGCAFLAGGRLGAGFARGVLDRAPLEGLAFGAVRGRGAARGTAWPPLPALARGRLGPLFRPAAAGLALAAALGAFVLLLGPEAGPEPGVVRWLDTHGQPVMVLDDGDATIIWLMQPDAAQAGSGGGWLGLI